MSGAKASPGPWEVRPGGAGGYGIAISDSRPSAGLLARLCPSTGRTDAQQLANAELMAAAPAMARALDAIADDCRDPEARALADRVLRYAGLRR